MGKTLLDDFLPSYDVNEFHDIPVRARPEVVFPTFHRVDLADSGLVKILLNIRGIPGRLVGRNEIFSTKDRTFTIDNMLKENFILLAEEAPREIVLGAVGCFWKPIPQVLKMEPASFSDFHERGYAKIGWNILIEEIDHATVRVSTQTRVQCLGKGAFLAFLPYWLMIRPFSGLIRKEMLAGIKKLAEAEVGG